METQNKGSDMQALKPGSLGIEYTKAPLGVWGEALWAGHTSLDGLHGKASRSLCS